MKATNYSRGSKDRTVRLLHIVGDSRFGGGSVIIERLAAMGQQMGWQVDVLTTDPILRRSLLDHKIGVVELDIIRREINLPHDLKGLIRLWRFLRQGDYDIVHTHTSKAGFIGRLAAKAAGVPVIIHTVHGFSFHEASSRKALFAYSVLERVAAYACHRIVTVSEYHRRWALKLRIAKPGKVVAIPNGISPNRVKAERDREAIRKDLRIGPGMTMLLSTGRLAEDKGLEFLIQATELMSGRCEVPFKVLFAGTGTIEPQLTKLAKELGVLERIRFLGFRKDIGALLKASDVVVLPTLHEGLSIALLEAMAAGKPIVTTRVGSNIEATQNGQAALLVPAKDPEALAKAACRFLRNSSLRVLKSAKASEVFSLYYTEDRMLAAYRTQYLELLESAHLATAVRNRPGLTALQQVYEREDL